MLPVDATLARRAVVLRAAYNILVPDSIQIATALESGATLFVTNDKRLATVRELRVLVLDDYVK